MKQTAGRLLNGRALSIVTALLCLGTAHAQPPTALDDAQILRALAPELPNARVSTVDSLTVQQRALFATGNALGFRFEHDLNGDGVTDLLLLGEYQDGLIPRLR